MTELEEKIGYCFQTPALLELALATPAVRMTTPDAQDNQRLEFLGDAVIGLLSADWLYAHFPEAQEGLLTVRRRHLVSGAMLAEVGERLNLRAYLKRNEGAQELPPRAKVLADGVEALLGAVWLDGGLESARAVFLTLGLPLAHAFNEWDDNPKGYLQACAQKLAVPILPIYCVINKKGTSHKPTITVRVRVEGLGEAQGEGASKNAAEVAAASALLKQIQKDAHENS